MQTTASIQKGGEFLISRPDFNNIYTPEDLNEEQLMFVQMTKDFINTEIIPKLDRIDAMEDGLMPSLLSKAGELGLLAASLPEAYGGFGKDFNTSLSITDVIGAGHSFAVALAAHVGIGTLPILYFGTDDQKNKYLPKLATGEWKASYCLTEPGSGSDALSAKTKAILSADGKNYTINGQKMWITNAGFADVFIVFAQIDGDKFTGFIVEKGYEGLSLGNEEHKMGIKGSSTRQVFFNDCKVPVENLLGEIGKGHLIAFNILNIGRIKLAAAAMGAAKRACDLSVKYANERIQFKLPISKFGAIKHKLAAQATRIFTVESAMYRASNDITMMESQLEHSGKSYTESILSAAEEFAIECAILKIAGSEMLDFVVDEGVQIFGGYGFSADYPMDRSYRDSRINRIFEGTNEINRLLIVDMLLKRALKGKLNLMGPAMQVQKELMNIPDFSDAPTGLLAEEFESLQQMKKAVLMIAGFAAQKYGEKLGHEQETIMCISDMIIDIYVAESTVMRVQKLANEGKNHTSKLEMAMTYTREMADKITASGKEAISNMCEGDELRMLLMGLKRFVKISPINTKNSRRAVADQMIEANGLNY